MKDFIIFIFFMGYQDYELKNVFLHDYGSRVIYTNSQLVLELTVRLLYYTILYHTIIGLSSLARINVAMSHVSQRRCRDMSYVNFFENVTICNHSLVVYVDIA